MNDDRDNSIFTPADPKLAAAYRDIVKYEQRVGHLLAELAGKEHEIRELKHRAEEADRNARTIFNEDIRTTFASFMRVAELQAMHQQGVLEALVGYIASRDGVTLRRMASDLYGSKAFINLLAPIAGGFVKETRQLVKIDIFDPSAVKMVRVSGEKVDDAEEGQTYYRIAETTDTGGHYVRFQLGAVNAFDFRRLIVTIRPDGGQYVHLRIRNAHFEKVLATVSLDLKAAAHYDARAEVNSSRRDINIRRLRGGWLEVAFGVMLPPSNDALVADIISIPKKETKSVSVPGDTKRAFAIRGVASEVASNLTPLNLPQEADILPLPQEAAPVQKISIHMPKDEEKRDVLRRAYLASGAYSRIAAMRGLHAGRRAFIIGNGPSINKQDLRKLRNEITFVTNWFVNHEHFDEIDPKYFSVSSHEMFGGWNNPEPALNGPWLERLQARSAKPTKIFPFRFKDYIEESNIFDPTEVEYLLFDRPKYGVDIKNDINFDLSMPMDDGYTGIITFCIPLAIHLGIKEIYLIGVDCAYGLESPEAPKKYFYDYSLHTSSTTKYESLKRIWDDDGPIFQAYRAVNRRAQAEGVTIVNLTDGGRLEEFPRMNYDSVVPSP